MGGSTGELACRPGAYDTGKFAGVTGAAEKTILTNVSFKTTEADRPRRRGRPTIAPELRRTSQPRTTVRLNEDLMLTSRRRAQAAGLSWNAYIEAAVRQALDQ